MTLKWSALGGSIWQAHRQRTGERIRLLCLCGSRWQRQSVCGHQTQHSNLTTPKVRKANVDHGRCALVAETSWRTAGTSDHVMAAYRRNDGHEQIRGSVFSCCPGDEGSDRCHHLSAENGGLGKLREGDTVKNRSWRAGRTPFEYGRKTAPYYTPAGPNNKCATQERKARRENLATYHQTPCLHAPDLKALTCKGHSNKQQQK